MFELFQFKKIGPLGPTQQIAIITILTLLSAAVFRSISFNDSLLGLDFEKQLLRLQAIVAGLKVATGTQEKYGE